MQFLKADETKIVRIGPCVDISDGYTQLATLDISTADYAYMLHEASTEVDLSSNTFVAVPGVTGYYDLTLVNAQLTSEGPMSVVIYDVDLCLPIRHDFHVVKADVYDGLFGSSAAYYLGVNTNELLGDGAAAISLQAGANAILNTATVTTVTDATQFITSLETDEFITANDAVNDRTIIFTGSETPALRGQSAVITDYIGGSGEIFLASGAITTPPVADDAFIIV